MKYLYVSILGIGHLFVLTHTKETALQMYHNNSLMMIGMFVLILVLTLLIFILGNDKKGERK